MNCRGAGAQRGRGAMRRRRGDTVTRGPMDRRGSYLSVSLTVVTLLLANHAAGPFAADAQQAGKVPRIGWLRNVSPPDPLFEAFRQGLRELGYIEGKSIVIEERWAEGKAERLPTLAAELVRLPVDLIVTVTTPAIQAAQKATGTIPIVMAASGDPVGAGLVASLARPGGNVTGLSLLGPELDGKRLELLKAALPKLTRVAFLWDPGNRGLALRFRELRGAARALDLSLQSIEVRHPSEIENALAAIAKRRPGAILIPAPMALLYREQITAFARRNRMPLMYDAREYVEAGGLISYGTNISDLCRRAATYVDKILKGAKPADLPVEQPTKFEMVINMKTAKALGLTIPRSVLSLADEVIQ